MEIIILPLPCSLLLKGLLASINLLKVSTSQKYQEQSKLESVARRDIKKKKYVSSCILLVTFFERLNTRRWLRLNERVKMYTLSWQFFIDFGATIEEGEEGRNQTHILEQQNFLN